MMTEKITLLYIDDEPVNLMLFERVFSRHFTIITGISGVVGLELLKKHPDIKIVISDMKMPRMNGVEFATVAKSEFKHIIFFILTGFDLTEKIIEAIDNKVIYKSFNKPFNIELILKTINEALNQNS